MQEPVQVVWAAQYGQWMFQDDFEQRVHAEKQSRLVNESIAMSQAES